MRQACIKDAVQIAENGLGPITEIAREAVEVGVIVPSILERLLEAGGYKIIYTDRDHTAKAEVMHTRYVTFLNGDGEKQEIMVAHGISHDRKDALLQAVYAAMREEQDGNYSPIEKPE